MGKSRLKLKILLFASLFLTVVFPFLHAQAGGGVIEDAATVYVIRGTDFNVRGSSRPFALIYHGEIHYGERITGRENFDRYLALKRQLLINQRVLEYARVEYRIGSPEADGALPVTLLIYARDTWNFFILPHPEYNSNDGFSLTLKARHYNFLGTMTPLRVDFGYNHNAGDHEIRASIESSTPFYAAGLIWTFRFDHFFGYTVGDPLFYQNVTGISVRLPWRTGFDETPSPSFFHRSAVTVGINQFLTVNEENSDKNQEVLGLDERFSGAYGSTELFASWFIPLGIEVGEFGQLSYTPRLAGRINYPFGLMDESRRPVTTFTHTLGFGRINWIGNHRHGLYASLRNSFSWYFDRADAPLGIDLTGNVSFHWRFTDFLGFSSRLNYRQWWHHSDRLGGNIPNHNSADMIRGVLNNHIRAYQILTLNLDFPVRVLRFWPSEWLNDERLRLFNFETQFSPFTDMAMFYGPYNRLQNRDDPFDTRTTFSLEDMINTAGLEVIVHPGFFRSLKIRASVGYNLQRIRDEGLSRRWGFFPVWDEIFIGLDFHY